MGLEAHSNCSRLTWAPERVTTLSELSFLYLQQEEMVLGLGLTVPDTKIVGTPLADGKGHM